MVSVYKVKEVLKEDNMIHINYLIQEDLAKHKKSRQYEISDTSSGIDGKFTSRKQFKKVELLPKISDVLMHLQLYEREDLRFDVPPELPHLETVGSAYTLINTRQDLDQSDIEKILNYFRRNGTSK